MLEKINKFIILFAVSTAFVSCCSPESRVAFAGTATPIPIPDELLILVEGAPSEDGSPDTMQDKLEGDVLADGSKIAKVPGKPTKKDIAPGSQSDWVSEVGGDTLLYTFDSANIQRTESRLVSNYIKFLKQYKDMKITVMGHTDAVGTREYNLALGERRAEQVKKRLIERGIDKKRIKTISYGEEVPVVNGDSDAAHAQNRRVEVLFRAD